MKSVTLSDIEHVQDRAPSRASLVALPRVGALALLLALGLPALGRAIPPDRPDAPRSATSWCRCCCGGLLPVARALTGRLEVTTRFEACHCATLDEALDRLGYAPAERAPGTLRYRARGARWPRWAWPDITVTVRRTRSKSPARCARCARCAARSAR